MKGTRRKEDPCLVALLYRRIISGFLDAVVKERERINYVKDIEDNRKVCFAEKDADEPWLDQTETLQKGLCRRLGL
ncbi:hypothetical protein CUMW_119190 [Citrus unshiu]|nr:hypothetical protein CUMW_119190 [Citrus unshiu]